MHDLAKNVMLLQKQWTDKNSPEMQQRGMNIRVGIPAWIMSHKETLVPVLGCSNSDFGVEGRDGTGRKTEIPWVRFFSREHSPSATEGWYCVYLFEAGGDGFYLALGHGSTRFIDGEFKPRSEDELNDLVSWAHELLKEEIAKVPRITRNISLGGRTKLGPAYERSTAAAIHYPASSVPWDRQFIDDAVVFASLLGKLYEAQDLGRAPEADSPEVTAAVQALNTVTRPLSKPKSGGQGFGLNSVERRAVELRAMEMASAYLKGLGYQTKDVSGAESYDIHAAKEGGPSLYVEVKGTTSGPSQVVLTTAEVALNRRHFPNTALIVVHSISLKRAAVPIQATDGVLYAISPWLVADASLTPLSFRYNVPAP